MHPGREIDDSIKTLALLLAGAIGMAALLAFLPAAGHDQLWFLLMAQRWLDGATIYGPQIFDSNPPLIVWFSAIPVALGRLLHVEPTLPAKLLVLLLEAASAALSLHLLRRLLAPITRARLLFLAFAFIVIFDIVPARDLGQRDHLTAILCLPYVLAASLNPREHPLRLLRLSAALLAAAGICLKPHHALIPLAVEVTLLVLHFRNHHRPSLRPLLRPEPLLLPLCGASFLLAIRTFTPAYFTLALPTLHDTYWAIGHLTLLQLLAESLQLHLLAALVLTLHLVLLPRLTRQPTIHRPTITLLIASASATTLAYYLQGTGWYYQQLPAISLFACALSLQLLELATCIRIRVPRWLPAFTAALTLLALALTTHSTGYPFTRDRAFAITTPDPTFFTALPPGTPVAILTTSVDDAMMPTARYHLLWSQRTNNLWTLPAILRAESPQPPTSGTRPVRVKTIQPQRLAELDRQQHAWMAEDLARWRPNLILVARCQSPKVHCQELEDRHDDLLAWFQRDPAFQQIWAHYHLLRSSGPYDAYTRTD